MASCHGAEGEAVTTKRDPRVDPRPGDVVRVLLSAPLLKDPWITRTVDRVRGDTVSWVVGRFGYDGSIEHWRAINATAEVVHVAEVAE